MPERRGKHQKPRQCAVSALKAEILASEGFEKKLLQILIRRLFYYSFPQIVHSA